MIPRPSFRLPIWGALAIVAAAYAVRSLVLRGGNFTPDLPGDAIAAAALAVGVSGVAWVRWRRAHEDPPANEADGSSEPRDGSGD